MNPMEGFHRLSCRPDQAHRRRRALHLGPARQALHFPPDSLPELVHHRHRVWHLVLTRRLLSLSSDRLFLRQSLFLPFQAAFRLFASFGKN